MTKEGQVMGMHTIRIENKGRIRMRIEGGAVVSGTSGRFDFEGVVSFRCLFNDLSDTSKLCAATRPKMSNNATQNTAITMSL